MLSRRTNGRFRSTPSLEELGFDVAKTERICNVCGEQWSPILISGQCTRGHQDSRPALSNAESQGEKQ